VPLMELEPPTFGGGANLGFRRDGDDVRTGGDGMMTRRGAYGQSDDHAPLLQPLAFCISFLNQRWINYIAKLFFFPINCTCSNFSKKKLSSC
jgi:hypothetical protein